MAGDDGARPGGTTTERRWRQPGDGKTDPTRAAQDLAPDEPMTGMTRRGNPL